MKKKVLLSLTDTCSVEVKPEFWISLVHLIWKRVATCGNAAGETNWQNMVFCFSDIRAQSRKHIYNCSHVQTLVNVTKTELSFPI